MFHVPIDKERKHYLTPGVYNYAKLIGDYVFVDLVIVNYSIYMEYLRPLLVYSVKQVRFFKGVGAQFGGTKLMKIKHIFRVAFSMKYLN